MINKNDAKMGISFVDGIKIIRGTNKPVSTAWDLSCEYLSVDPKIKKIISIIKEHENLFVNRNSYHNHYHFAEVVWSTAWLLEGEVDKVDLQEHAIILFLAATFHDAEHPGRGNKYAYELEKRSADFFRQWWRNNSLFVENLMVTKANDVENVVMEMILATDFIQGQDTVLEEYKSNKDSKHNGLSLVKLKKILTEADILLSVLPQYGLDKTSLMLQEVGQRLEDEEKIRFWHNFLIDFGSKVYCSKGATTLKIPEMIKELISTIKEELNNGNNSERLILQSLLNKFGHA